MAFARPFAYNPGTTIPGTEQIGNLSIGYPTSGFTNNPQYWNGPDEELGYVIAQSVSGNTQPTEISGVFASVGFFQTSGFSDSEFINLSQAVSSEYGTPQTFSTASEASVWLTNNGFWNSFIPINLLVYLDSGNPSSYPGTGSTWTDLEGGDDNATLFNSPTFSSSYQGILQFDDTSLEYATIPDLGNLSKWTVEAWFRLNSPLTGKVTAIVTNEFDLVDKLNFSIGTNNAPTNRNISVGFFDGSFRTTTGVVPQVGVWYQVVGTYDGSVVRQYVNGVASGGTVNYVGTPESGGEVRLMRRWDLTEIASNFVDGDLAIVKIYNTALSSSDILQSYNDTYTRFLEPTPTPTNTTTPTNTETPTNTPTETESPTPTPTVTNEPTSTPTPTPTPTSGATAPFSVSFVESGSNILMSYSGTLDLTGLDFVQNLNPGSGGVGAAQGAFGIGPSGVPNVSLYTGATFSYPSNFGTGGGGPSSVTGTGDYFGVFSGLYPTNTLVVPTGYTSGNFIQGTTTLSGSSFTSLGINTGNYNYSWGAGAGQSFVLTIGGVGPTPTPTATSVTPTPTPTSGYTGDGWLFYAPEGPVSVGPPDNNGNSIFLIQSTTTVTYNPNYTGATLNIFFNSGTTLGTSYLTQFQGLDVSGGTLTASQGSNTVIYSGNSSEYVVSPTGFLQLTLNRTAQMVQSASTPFVSGTTINVVVS
jgi:hypothetical protein